MLSQEMAAQTPQIQIWPIERLIEYARNPRKNDSAVDRMWALSASSDLRFPVWFEAMARSSMDISV